MSNLEAAAAALAAQDATLAGLARIARDIPDDVLLADELLRQLDALTTPPEDAGSPAHASMALTLGLRA